MNRLAKAMLWLYIAIMTVGSVMLVLSLSRVETQAVSEVGSGMPAAECWAYYDNGQHRQWAECMGVGYVLQ